MFAYEHELITFHLQKLHAYNIDSEWWLYTVFSFIQA